MRKLGTLAYLVPPVRAAEVNGREELRMGSEPVAIGFQYLGGRPRAITPQRSQTSNRLLLGLPEADFACMLPVLRRVRLKPRQLLHPANMPMEHVFFIEKGLVSVSAWCAPGRWVEVWLFGREGMCGIPVVLGGYHAPPLRRMVQVGGSALEISRSELRRLMDESATLRSLLLKFAQVVLFRSSQSSACNATHTVTQRLSRWLLLARESLGEDSIPLTHQVLSSLLGVRRATVTQCMTVLEQEGAIDRSRGRLVVIDASKLESLSCDCHRRIRREYERLLGPQRDCRIV